MLICGTGKLIVGTIQKALRQLQTQRDLEEAEMLRDCVENYEVEESDRVDVPTPTRFQENDRV